MCFYSRIASDHVNISWFAKLKTFQDWLFVILCLLAVNIHYCNYTIFFESTRDSIDWKVVPIIFLTHDGTSNAEISSLATCSHSLFSILFWSSSNKHVFYQELLKPSIFMQMLSIQRFGILLRLGIKDCIGCCKWI